LNNLRCGGEELSAFLLGWTSMDGYVAPGFETVAEAFAENFAHGLDLGAAFAVYRGDEVLVDIWGGIADSRTGRRWESSTIQSVFSGTKGILGVCMLMLMIAGSSV
jgi:CubicO group peptidase (beta-lactamase class C family)